MLQIVILAAVALFLFWRLRAVLGSREGYEKTLQTIQTQTSKSKTVTNLSSPEETSDNDITDYVEENSENAKTLKIIKEKNKDFTVQNFVSGAKNAYEIILMAFENSDLKTLKPLLEKPVYDRFESVLVDRKKKKLSVEANFIGVRDIRITNVFFDKKLNKADITLTFKSELTTVVKDKSGKVVEGDSSDIKKQKDVWTFSKLLSNNKPIWFLKTTS
tara:strand:+ start:221 stop:871 length:651 start_codon:yes stop_codon:yes gene_type:complete